MLQFLDWAVDVSPAFVHFVTDGLSETYFESVRPHPDHKCCHAAFVNDAEKQQYLARVQDHFHDKLVAEEEEFLMTTGKESGVNEQKLQNLRNQK